MNAAPGRRPIYLLAIIDADALTQGFLPGLPGQPPLAHAEVPLPPRHREILSLLARGLSTKEIAQRLKLSPKTVSAHRAKMMKRLGYMRQSELVAYAIKLHRDR